MLGAGGSLFHSTPNYLFISYFAGLGLVAAFLAARQRSIASGLFALTLFALAGWELSFAFVPVREWIRVDLLLTLPYSLLGLVVTIVRSWRSIQNDMRPR